MIKEVLLEGDEVALAEGGVSTPCGDVSIEVRPRLNRCKKIVDTRKFRNIVTGGGKELVVLSDGAAEISKIREVNERGQYGFLGRVNFVLGDGAEHSFEFAHELKR